MPLHSKVKGEDLNGQYLSVNPLYGREGESIDVPKHRIPDRPMTPDMAYEIVHDELMAAGRWPVRTYAPATTCRSPPTWARASA